MKTKKMIMTLFMMLILASGFAQKTTKKIQRKQNLIDKQHQIDSLINSRVFVFIATKALPLGGNSIDLTTNRNSLKFHPEKMESYMPFFGRAYSIDYGGNGGIKFEEKPDEYKVITKKGGKGYEIHASVHVTHDTYKLSLFVSPEGSAILTINSNQRSSISYTGNIEKYEVSEDPEAKGSRQKK